MQSESEGKAQTVRGSEFEAFVGKELSHLFDKVEPHAQIKGWSGVAWRVDFLVNESLVIEASVQRRLETKIASTFLKIVDITRKNDGYKAALILQKLHVAFHRGLDKKYFPTSEYRTMIQHGFPIMTPEHLSRLTEFYGGSVSAAEISDKPAGFNARSLFSPRIAIGQLILKELALGPLTRGEISKAIQRSPNLVDEVMKTLPQVKNLGNCYGLTEDDICKRFVRKGGRAGATRRRLALEWLEKDYMKKLKDAGHYRTQRFADDHDLKLNSLTHFIHKLSRDGRIRKVGKGDWSLPFRDSQGRLDRRILIVGQIPEY